MINIHLNKEVIVEVVCHTSYNNHYIPGGKYLMATEPIGPSMNKKFDEFISCSVVGKDGLSNRFEIKGDLYGDGRFHYPKFLDYFYDPIVFERNQKLENILK